MPAGAHRIMTTSAAPTTRRYAVVKPLVMSTTYVITSVPTSGPSTVPAPPRRVHSKG